jgi:hypothetical protein
MQKTKVVNFSFIDKNTLSKFTTDIIHKVYIQVLQEAIEEIASPGLLSLFQDDLKTITDLDDYDYTASILKLIFNIEIDTILVKNTAEHAAERNVTINTSSYVTISNLLDVSSLKHTLFTTNSIRIYADHSYHHHDKFENAVEFCGYFITNHGYTPSIGDIEDEVSNTAHTFYTLSPDNILVSLKINKLFDRNTDDEPISYKTYLEVLNLLDNNCLERYECKTGYLQYRSAYEDACSLCTDYEKEYSARSDLIERAICSKDYIYIPVDADNFSEYQVVAWIECNDVERGGYSLSELEIKFGFIINKKFVVYYMDGMIKIDF